MGRKKRKNFPVKEPDKHCVLQVVRVTSVVAGHISGGGGRSLTLGLCELPPKTFLQLSYKKNIRQVPVERHSAKYLSSTPQNCPGHENQGKSNKLSQPRGN